MYSSIKTAFIVSLILHSVIIFNWSGISIFFPNKKNAVIEVTYSRIPKSALPVQQKAASKAGNPLGLKIAAQKKILDTPVSKETPKVGQRQRQRNQSEKIKQLKKYLSSRAKKDVVIPPIPPGVEKMPTYMDYAQAVRDRINTIAHLKYKGIYDRGEVMISFVLRSDGALLFSKIIDEHSYSDERLRKITEQIISDAAPFGSFPPDLEYKQLSFSITISFQ